MAVVLLLLAVGAVAYFSRPQRLTFLATQLLAAMLDADVTVADARIGLDGNLRLTGVNISISHLPPEMATLLTCDQVIVRQSILTLVRGQITPNSLVFVQPMVYLTEDVATGRYNVEQLTPTDDPTTPPMPLPALPNVDIHHAGVVFGESRDGQYSELGRVHVSGSLTADDASRDRYIFRLRQDLPEGGVGPVLHGSLELPSLAVAAQLHGFTLETPSRAAMPAKLRDWWDRLAPQGAFPQVRFAYDPDPAVGLHAVLDVAGVSLNLPFAENAIRMTDVSGRFAFTDRSIAIENLVGRVEDFRYRVNGKMEGYADGVPLSLSARIEGVIPREPRYVPWFPEEIQREFARFDPSGQLTLNVLVTRTETDGKLNYDGQVDIAKARLIYDKFPYQLSDVSGRIRFDNKMLRVESLRATGPSGAKINVRGFVEMPASTGAAEFYVDALDAPVDQYLYNALEDHEKVILDDLFDVNAYVRLVDPEHGLLKAGPRAGGLAAGRFTAPTHEVDRPAFDLGGVATARIASIRPRGVDQKPDIQLDCQIGGVNIVLEPFAYPLRITEGRFTLGPGGATLEKLKFTGVTGGIGQIEGRHVWKTLTRADGSEYRKLVPDRVTFAGIGFPTDALLLSAIDPEPADLLRQLQLTAVADIAGLILPNEAFSPTVSVQVQVRDGRIQPFNGKYDVTDVTGELSAQGGKVTIKSITGKRGPTTFSLAGQASWSGSPFQRFVLEAKGMRLEDPISDLLPAEIAERRTIERMLATYRPSGTFDLRCEIDGKGGTETNYAFAIEPHTIELDLHKRRPRFERRGGRLIIGPQGLTIEGMDLAFDGGAGRLGANGDVTFRDGGRADLSLSMSNRRLDSSTQALLPQGLVRAFQAMDLVGAYSLEGANLTYQPSHPSQVLAFNGRLRLTDAKATMGVDLTEIDVTSHVSVRLAAGTEWPMLQVDMKADRLRATGRLIEPMEVRLFNEPSDPRQLRIEDVRGRLGGGILHGDGFVRMDEDNRFGLRLTLQDAALGSIIDPKGERPAREVSGHLSADLTLGGVAGDTDTRQGRGEIRVRNANLYELPTAFAFLQLLNLSAPTSRAFDRAHTAFLISGDKVRFETIRLESPTIDIEGSGTLDLASRAIMLILNSRNRGMPHLGAVSDLLRVVKDELVTIEVSGTLDNPEPKVRSLRGIRESLGNIMGDRDKTGNAQPPSSTPEGSAAPSRSGQ